MTDIEREALETAERDSAKRRTEEKPQPSLRAMIEKVLKSQIVTAQRVKLICGALGAIILLSSQVYSHIIAPIQEVLREVKQHEVANIVNATSLQSVKKDVAELQKDMTKVKETLEGATQDRQEKDVRMYSLMLRFARKLGINPADNTDDP